MPGSFGKLTAGSPKKARIEIIPLIDVIFFLLATFVLFTLSLDRIQSVPVDLPQAAVTARPSTTDDTVILQVSEAGTAFWNREPVALANLPRMLADYRAASANPRVLVSGDDKASYGDAVRALDEVRKAGIAQVSIETAFRPSGR
ncbi:MAG: biopolymer transporter ExbD [Opitutaceae bacterium]|jgi:biopolymer transport protein ExbD